VPFSIGGTVSRESYFTFVEQFYMDTDAMEASYAWAEHVIGRRNALSGVEYKSDPTIMAWELANEPRALNKEQAYRDWIRRATHLIRGIDCSHLVTVGSEGLTPYPSYVQNDLYMDHEHADYVTIHVWPQNWGWYDPLAPKLQEAWERSRAYIAEAVEAADAMGKPLVVEEFGLARDYGQLGAGATTHKRDEYYRRMCEHLAAVGASGLSFWAWGGEGGPQSGPQSERWAVGDEYVGDPPHEGQGWYSVYESDETTLHVIAECAKLFD